jgi:hypothetical protein
VSKLKLYQNEHLDKLRLQADDLADESVADLVLDPEACKFINSLSTLPQNQDWTHLPGSVQKYFQSFALQAEFADKQKIIMAQDYFSKEGHYYLSMLGFYSLPYCYAFGDGAEVLVRSKRITDEVGKRLSETALFLLDSFRPDTFLSDDRGLLSIAKVRLIHAFSRYFILKYAEDWKEEWGKPINQEDLLGTNLAFSLIVMRGLEKLNRFPGKETYEAILHYWKLIAYYLGIDVNYWPENAKEAFELEKSIRIRHIRSSEAGQKLIRSLLNFYQDDIPDKNLSQLVESLVSFFLGREVSDTLGVKQKVNLPKDAVSLLLRFNFWKEGSSKMSYKKIRSQFIQRQKDKFEEVIQLSVPIVKRS